jgi:hypothetical protein
MSLSIAAVIPIVGQVIDRIFPNKTEAAKAKALLMKAEQRGDLADLEFEVKQEEERTKRHGADMASDNWLSKNIRPGSLIFLLFVVSLLAVTDGNVQWSYEVVEAGVPSTKTWEFVIESEYIQLFKVLLVMAFGFYFTSRGVEKVADIIRSGKAGGKTT